MANKDSEEVTQSLLHTALVRGARDNVTLICVKNCDEADKLTESDDSTVIDNAASLDELDFDFD